MRTWVRSLASLSGLKIQRCHELWCRSQTQLRSLITVAVAVVGSCSFEPLAWELPYVTPADLKSKTKKQKKQRNNGEFPLWLSRLRTGIVSKGCRFDPWPHSLKIWHCCGCGVSLQLQLQFYPWPGNFHMP